MSIPEDDQNPEFVYKEDRKPAFWGFLNGLDSDDLLAELVQNDLDQGATRTVISFKENEMVCEGNGKPVDSEGWERLSFMRGAGDEAPAKQGGIGVKNHGLKTAFVIGDEIQILSDGKETRQTLYAGKSGEPSPGAWPGPRENPQAPSEGCRIVILYRDKNLAPPEGEPITLGAVGEQKIEELFKRACSNAPGQFAGVVSPDRISRYEIVLRHWRLGEARFVFFSRRSTPVSGRKPMQIFIRGCKVEGTASSLPDGLLERVVRRLHPLEGQLEKRLANYFSRRDKFFVEVSWSIDKRYRAKAGIGRFRYPIGYIRDSEETCTGHGASFNAPFVSDTERRGLARTDPTNQALRDLCEDLLVDALEHLVTQRKKGASKEGARALDPLAPGPIGSEEYKSKAIRPLLAKLARRKAIPTLAWRDAVEILLRSGGRKISADSIRNADRQKSREPRKYNFVLPVATWEPTKVDAFLSVLCPRSEMQVDPRIDRGIVRLLAERDSDESYTEGFYENFVTFDENDALLRVKGEDVPYFHACKSREKEFAHPLIARSCLDMIRDATDNGNCPVEGHDELRAALLLPDTHGQAAPFPDLCSGASLPYDLPGLDMPPVLHLDLASHRLLRRDGWRLEKFTMAKFLGSGQLQEADEQTRRKFWRWLRKNEQSIGPRDRPALRGIAVWPDTGGVPRKFSDLCSPKNKRIAAILAESIRQPHAQVRGSKLSFSEKKRETLIRHNPNGEEIGAWLERRTAPFTPGEMADESIVTAMERLESDLTALLRDSEISLTIKKAEFSLPAIAQDGSVRLRKELVAPGKDNERLALSGRFLLENNPRVVALSKVFPSLSGPAPGILLSTLKESPENSTAWKARLRKFVALTEPFDEFRARIYIMPVVPIRGQSPRAPRDLAFRHPKTDYWGDWKIPISTKYLSQDDKERYLKIGVTPSSPTSETKSRKFFEWLSGKDAAALDRHIPCVLRHILHENGPVRWGRNFPDTPFIPVENFKGMRLVSLSAATARNSKIYLGDVEKISDEVSAKDPDVLLVIDSIKSVPKPVTQKLRDLGLKSLREAIGEPVRVNGIGDPQEAPDSFREKLEFLCSPDFRRTLPKRFNRLDVEWDHVRSDWHENLRRIKSVMIADRVEAEFRFNRREYFDRLDAGLDPESNTFWMDREQGVDEDSLYEAVAKQLVFKSAAKR
ncbi:MAG: hypothetical protein MPJ82_01095, partial [Alphaproteobacteria bacterium]|nr:hypothetical protein [Alphaproteobacteria bacterium]